MNQPPLFRPESSIYCEACRVIDSEGNVEHRARANDPATSHEAAEAIKHELTPLRAAMLEAFQSSASGLTDNEAAAWCVRHKREKTHETYRKRGGEIRDRLVAAGTRRCTVTGSNANVWRAK